MEASAGGGSILVEPGSLDAMSGRIAGVANGTSAARAGREDPRDLGDRGGEDGIPDPEASSEP